MVLRFVVLVAAGWLVATQLRPDTETAAASGEMPGEASTALAALVVDVTTGMLLVVGGWVALAGLVGAATTIPGRSGRLAAAAWAWLVPRAARAVLAAVVGVGAASTPAMAAASGPPTDGTGLSSRGADQVPVVARPTTQGAWSEAGSAPAPEPSGSRRASSSPDGREQTITVHAGDSLWAIAARHLGPGSSDAQVAAEWPRWFALNRATIGPDPDRLLTGTVLTVPASSGGPR